MPPMLRPSRAQRRGTLLAALGSALAVVGLVASGCVSTSDIEGLQNQLSDVQRQLLQLQKQAPSKEEVSNIEVQVARQMESLLKSEADMQVRLQAVSSQIDQLQANLEDTNYRLAQLSQQIAATNQELKGFRPAPAAPLLEGAGGESGASPSSAGGATSDPQTLYQTAYNDYLRGNYDLAVREFQDYLDNFPDTDLTDNAVYWIGECYYRQGKFRPAISQFDAVLNRYPRSDKLPSALLKKGYSHLQLGERAQGVVQLQHVIAEYPSSDEANLARQRLRELGVEPG
jgi:tol-pal system protein YbgF